MRSVNDMGRMAVCQQNDIQPPCSEAEKPQADLFVFMLLLSFLLSAFSDELGSQCVLCVLDGCMLFPVLWYSYRQK